MNIKSVIRDLLDKAVSVILNAIAKHKLDLEGALDKAADRVVSEVKGQVADLFDHIDHAHQDTQDTIAGAVEGFNPFKDAEKAAKAAAKAAEKAAHDAGKVIPDVGGSIPDPAVIIKKIEDAANGAVNQVKSVGNKEVNQVKSAGESAVLHIEGSLSQIESAVEKALHSIIEGIEKGALTKAADLLEVTSHTGFSLSFGPVSMQWDDVSQHIDAFRHLASHPPSTHQSVIKAIKTIWPDNVSITVDVALFSSDLGAGFSVTFATQDFIDHADSLLSKV